MQKSVIDTKKKLNNEFYRTNKAHRPECRAVD